MLVASDRLSADTPLGGEQLAEKPPVDASKHFVTRLCTWQRLYKQWTNKENCTVAAAQCEELLDFIRECASPELTWALVEAVLRNSVHTVALPGGREDVQRRALHAAFDKVKDDANLGYVVRYERARQLLNSGWQKDARRQFADLYEQTLRRGDLPRIGPSFRDALRGSSGEKGEWSEFMQRAARRLVAHGRRPEVVTLANQCHDLEDPVLAEQLLQIALDGVANDPQRAET